MNMRLMGISAEILHSMWIVFLLHIVFLDGNADFKRSLITKMNPETNSTWMLAMMKKMEMESPRDFHLVRKKRDFDEKTNFPVCRNWYRQDVLRYATLLKDNTTVKVARFMWQWHIRLMCHFQNEACRGIDTSRYYSKCVHHKAADCAWVYLPDPKQPDGWSGVPHFTQITIEKACVCRISEKP